MTKKIARSKGELIWDESTDNRYIPIFRDAKWKVKKLKPTDRNARFQDSSIGTKYGKNHIPIITQDAKFEQTSGDKTVSGIILLKQPRKEVRDSYDKHVHKLAHELDAKTLSGKKICLEIDGTMVEYELKFK